MPDEEGVECSSLKWAWSEATCMRDWAIIEDTKEGNFRIVHANKAFLWGERFNYFIVWYKSLAWSSNHCVYWPKIGISILTQCSAGSMDAVEVILAKSETLSHDLCFGVGNGRERDRRSGRGVLGLVLGFRGSGSGFWVRHWGLCGVLSCFGLLCGSSVQQAMIESYPKTLFVVGSLAFTQLIALAPRATHYHPNNPRFYFPPSAAYSHHLHGQYCFHGPNSEKFQLLSSKICEVCNLWTIHYFLLYTAYCKRQRSNARES